MMLDQVVGRLGQVGPPERVVVDVVGGDRVAVLVPLHAGVAEGAEAAEEPVVGDAELGHRVGELAAAVLAEPVLAVGGEVLELGTRISPISPAVQVTSVTPRPSATYFAIVAPWPIDSSSGWACTSSRRWSAVMPPA